MSTICYPENNNSYAVEDWNTVGVSCQGVFTSTVPVRRAPEKADFVCMVSCLLCSEAESSYAD